MRYRSVPFLMITGALMLILSTAATAEAVECSYRAKTPAGNTQPELGPQGNCGEFVGQDGFWLYPDHLAKMYFQDGRAELLVDGKAFYIAKSGKAVRVHLFDNGADPFSQGLARTIAAGKFGFLDKSLAVVITPAYDFAFPFANNKAVVCNGCSLVAEGEHHDVRGGVWGMIDKKGATIVPIIHSREAVEKMPRSLRGKESKP